MDSDDRFINPVESNLLTSLVDLYLSDLAQDGHCVPHSDCLACAKQDIIRSITHYIGLDALVRSADVGRSVDDI